MVVNDKTMRCARLLQEAAAYARHLRDDSSNPLLLVGLVRAVIGLQRETGASADAVADAVSILIDQMEV